MDAIFMNLENGQWMLFLENQEKEKKKNISESVTARIGAFFFFERTWGLRSVNHD